VILTLVETDLEGAAIEVSLEALSFARDISAAGNGVPVDAVVFGDLSDALRGELAAYGVRNVHHVGGEGVAAYSGAGWASAIQQVRDAAGSVVVMAAGTDRGTELMAHVATRSGASMAANVLSFSGLAPFVVTRQVVGGAAMEEMNLHQRPAVFTVAGHAVEAKPAPEYAATSSPTTWWIVRTPYAASSPRRSSDRSPNTTASTGTPLPAAEMSRANESASSETSMAAPSRSVSTRVRIIS
jgi:electron transfer flavoprotein alpha subunit